MNIENLYTPDCIRTYTGIYMNVFEPTLEMIHIEDIAHALSMQCRFGGHLYDFYSVVQKQIREDHVGNGTKPIVSRRFYRGYTIRNHGYYPPDKCVWWEAVDDKTGCADFHAKRLRDIIKMIDEALVVENGG